MRSKTQILGRSLSILILGGAVAAQAQTSDPVQKLFEEAVTEMQEKKYESACAKFERVVKERPDGVGAKMALAECYEGWGRLASAVAVYTHAEQQALQKNQQDRANEAAKKAAALKSRLSMLIVEVPDSILDLPKFSLKRDGEIVEQGKWNTPVPVDVGRHELEAEATGYEPWKEQVEITRQGETVKRVVKLEPMKLGPIKKDKTATSTAPKETRLVPQAIPKPSPAGKGWQKPLGIAGTVLGVAGLAGGIVAIVLGRNKFDESNQEHCFENSNRCDSIGLEMRDSAQVLVRGGSVTATIGVLVAVGGVVLWSTAPSSGPKTEKDQSVARTGAWRASFGIQPGGIHLQGSF